MLAGTSTRHNTAVPAASRVCVHSPRGERQCTDTLSPSPQPHTLTTGLVSWLSPTGHCTMLATTSQSPLPLVAQCPLTPPASRVGRCALVHMTRAFANSHSCGTVHNNEHVAASL